MADLRFNQFGAPKEKRLSKPFSFARRKGSSISNAPTFGMYGTFLHRLARHRRVWSQMYLFYFLLWALRLTLEYLDVAGAVRTPSFLFCTAHPALERRRLMGNFLCIKYTGDIRTHGDSDSKNTQQPPRSHHQLSCRVLHRRLFTLSDTPTVYHTRARSFSGGDQELFHQRVCGAIHPDPISRRRYRVAAGRVSEGERAREVVLREGEGNPLIVLSFFTRCTGNIRCHRHEPTRRFWEIKGEES